MMDLFAGCGGLGLGMEQAGFKTVFVNELNSDAMESYLMNRHHKIGGAPFSSLRNLHCYDINQMTSKRLNQLVSDFKEMPDIGFEMDACSTWRGGGGSNIDLIAGGPPCQGFSGIGHRRSYSVDRSSMPANRLYVRMANIIRHIRPRIFLFENVRGIINAKWEMNGSKRVWEDVYREFSGIDGYDVRWTLMHSKNYGVPQNRPRVLLVGIRCDIVRNCDILDTSADKEDAVTCGFLPEPKLGQSPGIEELLGDLVDNTILNILLGANYPRGAFETTKYPQNPSTDIQKQLRQPPDHLQSVELTEHTYSKHRPHIVRKFQYMLNHNGEIPEKFRTKKFAQRVLPRNWGEEGPTITAASLPDDYVHFCQPRSLTVREWARIQLFPDWYQFAGKRTTGGLRRAGNPRVGLHDRELPKYTQIGNAVPVELARTIGVHFKKILEKAQ